MSLTVTRETGESVTFDAMLRESHNLDVRITEHPIERGASVSDHAQARPREFIVTVLVSETPLDPQGQPRFTASAIRSATLIPASGPSLEGAQNRVREFFDFLAEIAQAGEFVDVVTPKFGLIAGVVISRIPVEIDNVNLGRFTIGFREVRIAERVTVLIPPLRPAPEAQAGAPDEQDVGTQPTDNPESTEEAEDASILYGIGETFGFV